MNEMESMRKRLADIADDLSALTEFADPGEALNLLLKGDSAFIQKRVATLCQAAELLRTIEVRRTVYTEKLKNRDLLCQAAPAAEVGHVNGSEAASVDE